MWHRVVEPKRKTQNRGRLTWAPIPGKRIAGINCSNQSPSHCKYCLGL